MVSLHSVDHCCDTFSFLAHAPFSQVPAVSAFLTNISHNHCFLGLPYPTTRAGFHGKDVAGHFLVTSCSTPGLQLVSISLLLSVRSQFDWEHLILFLPVNAFWRSFSLDLNRFFRPSVNVCSKHICTLFRSCVNLFWSFLLLRAS